MATPTLWVLTDFSGLAALCGKGICAVVHIDDEARTWFLRKGCLTSIDFVGSTCVLFKLRLISSCASNFFVAAGYYLISFGSSAEVISIEPPVVDCSLFTRESWLPLDTRLVASNFCWKVRMFETLPRLEPTYFLGTGFFISDLRCTYELCIEALV